MTAGVLLDNPLFGKFDVTLTVLLAGAVWFVPAATVTVIVALPFDTPRMVTVVPDTLTVATLVLLDDAETAPSPGLVTVMFFVIVDKSSVTLAVLKESEPVALPILHVTNF